MNNEIKEILEALKPQDEEFTKVGIKEYPLVLSVKEQKILLDCITNLQTIEQQYSAILSENAELENKITNLQEELEEEKRIEQASLDTINNLQDTLKDREEYCYGLETQLTNLQEEVKSANESITWWQNRFNALQEENKRLKENAEHNDKVVDEVKWNENIYKSRINKAIEYINKNKHIDDYGIWIIEDDNDYLLNILEGSNKDE